LYSGRARQVPRAFLAARMHLRVLAREGHLAQVSYAPH
jgi:ribosomal protein S14